MALNIGVAFKNSILDQLDTTFPAGSTLKVYTGSRPTNTTDAATGTLLYTVTLPATPWAAASGGSKSKNGTWSATSVAAGASGWARLANAADNIRVDFTVGTSGADIIVNTVTVLNAKTQTITAITVTA